MPGLSVEMAQLMEDLIGDLTGVTQPVEIKLFSDDPGAARRARATARRALVERAGRGRRPRRHQPGGDALQIHVDPAAAALEGVDPATVAKLVGDVLNGTVATPVLSGVLLFMYESFAMAASIMLTSLPAVSAVFIGLWLTRIELTLPR